MYVFEAWTAPGEGNRNLFAIYYDEYDGINFLGKYIDITETRKTYTVRGDMLPKDGNRFLGFWCADQLGTFYVKVLEIREMQPGDESPENWSVEERWRKETHGTATLDYSIDSNDVVTVTVSGTPEPHNETDGWYRWKADVRYLYTAKAGKKYIYEIEMWTEFGTIEMDIQYYEDNDNWLAQWVRITDTKTTYTIAGQTIPKDSIQPLRFQCADQLGTFYVKVLEIREALPDEVSFYSLTNKGIQSRNNGNLDSAIAEFTEALRLNPN